MQLTINIDSSNLSSTVEEVFQSLSTEERKSLAKDIMLEVLTKPINSARVLFARSGRYFHNEEKLNA